MRKNCLMYGPLSRNFAPIRVRHIVSNKKTRRKIEGVYWILEDYRHIQYKL